MSSLINSIRTSKNRSALWTVLRVVLGVILLVFIFRSLDWHAFGVMLTHIQPIYVVLALGINFVNLALSAKRWQVLLRAQGVDVPVLTLSRYYLISMFFNNYLPPFVGADAIRMIYLRESKSVGVRTVSVLIERGFGVFALLGFGAFAVLAIPSLREYTALSLLIVATFSAVVIALGALLVPESWFWVVRRLQKRLPRFYNTFEDIAETGKSYRTKKRALLWTILISILIQFLVIFAFEFRALAFDTPVRIEQMMLIAPAITVLTLIPLAPGDLGTQEAFFTLAFGMIGISTSTALGMSLLARVLDLVLGGIGAVLWLRNR